MVTLDEPKKGGLNLEGRGFETVLIQKAYSWLEDCFLKPKQADLTGPVLATSSRLVIGTSVGEIPTGEPCPTTGRTGGVREEVFWSFWETKGSLPGLGKFFQVW